jgi:hypothetical protein
MAAADARYNNAHRAHSFTTDTARVGGEPSSEILGSTVEILHRIHFFISFV